MNGTVIAATVPAFFVTTLTGCSPLHSGMTKEQIDTVINREFSRGMPYHEVKTKVLKLGAESTSVHHLTPSEQEKEKALTTLTAELPSEVSYLRFMVATPRVVFFFDDSSELVRHSTSIFVAGP